LKPARSGGLIWDPVYLGLNRAGLKKKREKEKPGVTRQDPVANPLTFFLY
jgi:hypothetical protein